ncbi:UspA domain-containing protein [Salinarchaeum sp. Harcht-Bsk1]|uniref:universal stress protein n=1 Tax=Salinarchaeum sp. Harcht-Bsk1 TaxID=1333523 RepID=UPI000342439B|nr:universal stress protein [Salinarchaeum sp. Harcht-Bsk1]AGN01939.1 UspA domain-containing protein [Salinarchaeum sp. Harcht-Bsk1]
MRSLLAVDTVHTAAAAADYLDDRLDRGDDVVALAVVGPDDAGADATRDGKEALNVLGVRLATVDVETVERRGEPSEVILDLAETRDVDQIVLGARAGTPDAATDGVGSTTVEVLEDATVPVVVLPIGEH